MDMKRGTPGFGIVAGLALVALGALVMLIGFWRTLILAALFAVGYFLGTVEDKGEFMRNAANKLIPDKEAKVIDLKSELAREQEMNQKSMMTQTYTETFQPNAADEPAAYPTSNTEDEE